MMENKHHIRIDFQPASPISLKAIDSKIEKKYYKEDTKHFYLCGVASGLSIDGHGERMDEEAVKGMHEQFQTKDIPLYVNHGKDYTEDIGLLTSSKILDNGDLYHEYRLYDDSDRGSIPEKNIQLAKHVRVISAGLPPYRHPRIFGFSIEGYVPDERIKYNPATGGKRIMQVDLDPGVSLVTKPAYQSSVANAVVKSLNGTSKKAKAIDITEYGFKPSREETPQHPAATQADEVKPLIERVISRHTKDIFYEQSVLEDALDATLAEILNSDLNPSEKKNELQRSFDYFRDRMLELFEQFGFSKPLNSSFDQLLSPQGSAPSLAQKALAKTNILRKKIKMSKTQKMDGQAETLLQDILAKLEILVNAQTAEAADIDALLGAEESELELEDQIEGLEKEDETEDVEKEDDSEEVGKEDDSEEDLAKEEQEMEAAEKAIAAVAKRLLKKSSVKKEEQSEGGDALGTAEERTDEVLPVDPEVVKTLKALKDLIVARKSKIKAKKKKSAAKKSKSSDVQIKVLKGMLSELTKQKNEQSETQKALGKLAEVLGLAPEVQKTQKGLAMNIGGMDLQKVIKEEVQAALGVKQQAPTLRQNPSIVGAIFGGKK